LPGLLPAQTIPAGFPVLEERARVGQLKNDSSEYSFMIRPIQFSSLDSAFYPKEIHEIGKEDVEVTLYPIINTFRITNKRPYGWGDYGMIPTPGFQWYASGGGSAKWKNFKFTFLPEFVYSQNKGFKGFQGFSTSGNNISRFFYWNLGDNPERYGNGALLKLRLGQSSLSYGYGAFEVALATHNIWWGPGQFNSLTFSNNAPGFPHLSINTRKPAKTFLGNIEVQLLSGRLESERYPPTQSDSLNKQYFKPYRDKWRYVNALVLSWNPKWVKGLHVGGTRTVQTFADSVSLNFTDILPVFWGLTKESVGSDLVGKSDRGKSQQITFFGRYVFQKANAEIYFEFGKRDHALNWRELILNPEHARAYIFGFNKIFEVNSSGSKILVRGEMTQQQESVNRYIRYPGLGGGATWHTNGSVGGFTNFDQPIGVGLPTGSNVQMLEVSRLENLDKAGFFIERLAYNNDFYYKALLQFTEHKPWVDLSLGFLFEKQFDNLLLSSKLQLIHARNYQWQTAPESTSDFPKGENLTSMMGQVSMIYFWKKRN
jgi:hypothetical protein